MEFGNNILKNESAYYELKNASISNGILTIRPGGSAKCTIDSDYIVRATEYFLVNMIVDPFTDNYNPKAQTKIHFVSADEKSCYNYSLFPVESPNGVYSQQIKLKAGEYKDFTFEISSKETIRFLVWELCPEAADEDIKTVIAGVEQSLPKLLYDYNTWPLHVGQDERTIALITFRLLNQTDLQGHFQVTYVASEPTTLTLRFKDNETTELFAPLMYDLHAGRGSVGVPHAYLERLAGIHSLIVTAQVTHGSLAIETRGILFTIDGGYLAERMLDIGADVRDISIRQLAQDYGPDEIWIIGIEAGEAIVRKRKYDPKATIGFEPQFSLGYAKDAAIEFDGDWVLRPDAVRYTIETYEDPWVFWIDKNDNLLAQIGNDETSKVLIATGVSQCFACRGYSSTIYVEQDQGLIIAYVKSGKACYRQYRYIQTEQKVMWDSEVMFDEYSDVTFIAVHRLNDYRVSFEITTSAGNYWLISDRTYVNQAIPLEHAYTPNPSYIAAVLSPTINLNGIEVPFVDKTQEQSVFTIKYDYPLKVLEYADLKEIITVKVNSKILDNRVDVVSIAISDNYLIITLKEAVSYNQNTFADGVINITIKSHWMLRLYIAPFVDLVPSQDFSWHIVAPIVEREYKLAAETIHAPNVSTTVQYLGVQICKYVLSEIISVPTPSSTELLQNKVTLLEEIEGENITTPVLTVTTLRVGQVGESPI